MVHKFKSSQVQKFKVQKFKVQSSKFIGVVWRAWIWSWRTTRRRAPPSYLQNGSQVQKFTSSKFKSSKFKVQSSSAWFGGLGFGVGGLGELGGLGGLGHFVFAALLGILGRA
jgi:hypothetical protein